MDQEYCAQTWNPAQSGAPVANPAVKESPIAAMELGDGGFDAAGAAAGAPTTSAIVATAVTSARAAPTS